MTVVPTPSHLPQPALSEDFQEQSYWAFRGSGGQGNVCWLVAGQAQLLSAFGPAALSEALPDVLVHDDVFLSSLF